MKAARVFSFLFLLAGFLILANLLRLWTVGRPSPPQAAPGILLEEPLRASLLESAQSVSPNGEEWSQAVGGGSMVLLFVIRQQSGSGFMVSEIFGYAEELQRYNEVGGTATGAALLYQGSAEELTRFSQIVDLPFPVALADPPDSPEALLESLRSESQPAHFDQLLFIDPTNKVIFGRQPLLGATSAQFKQRLLARMSQALRAKAEKSGQP